MRAVQWGRIDEDGYADYVRFVERAFGEDVDDDRIAAYRCATELDRTVVARDGDTIVATGSAFGFELTLEGGATIPVGAVTDVAVRSTHRRRGLLREVIGRLHADSVERAEAATVLLASESSIYGRFGYGVASWRARYEVETRGLELTAVDDAGSIDEIDAADAYEAGPVAWDRYRRATPGALNGTPGYWRSNIDWPDDHDRYHVIHRDVDGAPDGWAAYHVEETWTSSELNDSTLVVEWMGAATPQAHLALWHHLLRLDLVSRIRVPGAVDDLVRWTLADPRRLAVTGRHDMSWIRLTDVERCLSARSYAADGTLVLDVAGGPGATGRLRLTVVDGTATVEACEDDADVAVTAGDLVSMWSGAVGPGVLADAGRSRYDSDAARRRAIAMFAVARAPACLMDF